jgi:hypothetical protein
VVGCGGGEERWRQKDEERSAATSTPDGQDDGFLSRPVSSVPPCPAAAKKGAGLRHAANDADKRQWGGGLPADCTSAGLRSPHQHASSHFGVGRGSAVCGISPIQSPADNGVLFFSFFFLALSVGLRFLFLGWSAQRRGRVAKARERDAVLPGFEGDALLPSGWAEVENHGTFLMPES